MKKPFSFLVLLVLFFSISANSQVRLLVGTYTNFCKSDGIYVYDFDPKTGNSKLLSQSKNIVNPSYLTVSSDNKNIWSVNEDGEKSAVSAFSFDFDSGKMKFINSQSTQGADPCFIFKKDQYLFTANYSGGSISVFKTDETGKINPMIQQMKHEGRSLTSRQKSPHVHQVLFSPDSKYLFATDLGTDRIYKYLYDANSEKEILNFYDSIPVKTASGPRHMTFSPNGKNAYLLQELDGTLTGYHYKNDKLARMQETSVVDKDFKGEISAADIHISADNQFLYASNRGDANEISVFSIAPETGRLKLVERVSTLGKGPRNFALSPDGKFLLVAHQYSSQIVIFNRDQTTGKLTDSGKRIDVCAPVCLVFAQKN